jgi:hypothetical protein
MVQDKDGKVSKQEFMRFIESDGIISAGVNQWNRQNPCIDNRGCRQTARQSLHALHIDAELCAGPAGFPQR